MDLASGATVPGDLVVLAIGMSLDTTLAAQAVLEVGPRGGIAVEDCQRTSDPAIYAIGDAVENRDAGLGGQTMVRLAQVANRQGRRAADAIAGRRSPRSPRCPTAIVTVFDLTVATTSAIEKQLRTAGTLRQHPPPPRLACRLRRSLLRSRCH